LLYTGRESIWRDIRRFTEFASKTYPKIQSDLQMRQLVTRVTVERAKTQRASYLHIFIPGLDILGEDLTAIPAWPWLSPDKQLQFIGHEEAHIPPMSLADRQRMLDKRAAQVNQPHLSRSYAWCERNDWSQDVEDADYDLIMATPAKAVMWDPDLKGIWTPPPRAFDGEELFPFTEVPIANWDEAEKAVEFYKRKSYTQGATVE
jgi:hypothetical protein